MICDYKDLRTIVGEDRLILIDEAHGTHLYFDEKNPQGSQQSNAVDMSVNSLHKNIGGLSGLALLNVGKRGKIQKEYINDLFMMMSSTSTNPYFLFDGEGAVRYMIESGNEILTKCYQRRNRVIEELKDVENIHFMGDFQTDGSLQDFTKLILRIPGLTGAQMYSCLLQEKFNIEAEKYTELGLVVTIHTNIEDREIDHLIKCLREIATTHKNSPKITEK